MSRGFVAIDRSALALCASDDEAMCLFMLMRAQDSAWSPSNPCPSVAVSRSYWSGKCGLTEGAFRQFIDRLVEAGRATVEHPGDRRTAKRIRFLVDCGPPPVQQTSPPTSPPSTDSQQPAQLPNPANLAANLAATILRDTILPSTQNDQDPPNPPAGGRTPSTRKPRARDAWDGTLPSWLPPSKAMPGETREAALAAVLATLRMTYHGPPPAPDESDPRPEVDPRRCKTDAEVVLRFWERQGQVGERPPLVEFAADLELVAHAARGCPANEFARDIRAEGWAEGTNRMDHIDTLCRREVWGARLRLARFWRERGYPTVLKPKPGPAPPGGTRTHAERVLAGEAD
jgi:hypothetical protein